MFCEFRPNIVAISSPFSSKHNLEAISNEEAQTIMGSLVFVERKTDSLCFMTSLSSGRLGRLLEFAI